MIQTLQSSNLKKIAYSAKKWVLYVEFHSGNVYRYLHVPPSIIAGLLKASSHGSYFHHHIRLFPEKYPYKRIK